MHPAWMVLSIALAGWTLRAGLALRRARRSRGKRADLRRAHLRVAKPAVAFLVVGFLGGPLSAWLLRGWTPFGTFHAWLGVVAIGLFGAAAVLGHGIERYRTRDASRYDLHALLGALGFLVAAVAVVAGFVLLP